MKEALKNNRGITLVVLLMLMVLLLAMTGAGLLLSGLDLKVSTNFKAGTQALYAADTGINVGAMQLSLNQAAATAPFAGTISGPLAYQSGRRGDSVPQPLQFRGIRTKPGYSIGVGTGYNPSGYVFYAYQINVTGTGPVSSAREIEAQVEYGPVPN